MSIVLEGISKRFGDYTAVDQVDLSITPGELMALLGPSGSGKTTLLRLMGGLEFADAGRLMMDGQDATNTAPQKRRAGFVFQQYALFRHMTVYENVAFGLRVDKQRKWSEPEIRARVNTLLERVQLADLGDRYPNQISGGQRQRVALARALAIEPRVLLLDEPFGALDAKVRKELRRWLRELHDETGVTTVFVTHDQEEALELADRVAILNQARVEQVGTPQDIYDQPASAFVCEFLGDISRLPCTIRDGVAYVAGIPLPRQPQSLPFGQVVAYVRPHDVEIVTEAAPDTLQGHVQSLHAVGASIHAALQIHDGAQGFRLETIVNRNGNSAQLTPGSNVAMRLKRALIYPAH